MTRRPGIPFEAIGLRARLAADPVPTKEQLRLRFAAERAAARVESES